LRGLALQLVEFFDAESLRQIAEPMGARAEYYPSGISCEALAKTAHFSSFPEHIQFVSHLTPDVEVIDSFSTRYREGESIAHAASIERVFDLPAVVMNPSVCYHCYNALSGQTVEKPGRAVTARSRCQRFEAGNHATLRRLMDFTMREVIFVGEPNFVLEARADTLRRLQSMFERWEMACRLESSNDPFFTDDYATKAAFQRHQDLKYELQADLPFPGGGSVAVASSNYHSVTFGRAFGIKTGARPACTGCLGFGLERLMYVVFAQFGLEPERWPEGLRMDFDAWRAREEPA
jgi:seryl-tRNA synthetase